MTFRNYDFHAHLNTTFLFLVFVVSMSRICCSMLIDLSVVFASNILFSRWEHKSQFYTLCEWQTRRNMYHTVKGSSAYTRIVYRLSSMHLMCYTHYRNIFNADFLSFSSSFLTLTLSLTYAHSIQQQQKRHMNIL